MLDSNKKQIFITNGMARCGKDTFFKLLNEIVPTLKYSAIDKIKEIAKLCEWDGGKTERDRRFLSDLKILTTNYSDLSFNEIEKKVNKFKENKDYMVMLIDIREPEEIERAKKAFNAKTILIKNDRVKFISSNMADANVFNYNYDFIVENNGTLKEFEENIVKFVKNNINETLEDSKDANDFV